MIYACAGNAGRSVRHNRHTQKIDGIWGLTTDM
nr:MAG TPA: tyrosine phosphatase [Inoviridae sp.]